MTARKTTARKKTKPAFTPGRGYSKKDWDEVSDNPELTEAELGEMKPFAEVLPELAANMKKKLKGRPKKESPKQAISIRLDQDIIEKFKATGPGWQTRINDALKRAKV